MKNLSFTSLILALLILLAPAALRAGNQATQYETGFSTVSRMAVDLHRALDPQHRQVLTAQPVIQIESDTPFLQAKELAGRNESGNTVMIPESCVALVNYLSHAKAMDEVNEGYFTKTLTAMKGDNPALSLVSADLPKAWSLDTMNLQTSHFNQIMGALVAIDMAHHYLGHYAKYAASIETAARQGKPISINSLLTKDEWQEAVLKGARNSLDCGLGVTGMKSLLQGIEAMPERPSWTLCFSPVNAPISRIANKIQAMENSFFLVDY